MPLYRICLSKLERIIVSECNKRAGYPFFERIYNVWYIARYIIRCAEGRTSAYNTNFGINFFELFFGSSLSHHKLFPQ